MAHAGKLTALLTAARQDGDPAARERAFSELLRLLTIFVRAGMGESLRRHRESVDICQSVAKSFVSDLRDGRLEFPTEAALVAYLQQVVRTKLAQAARHDRAQKRGGGVVVHGLEAHPADSGLCEQLAGHEPSGSAHLAGKEYAAQMAIELSGEDQELIRLRQSGLSWDEIALRLEKTPAAVRKSWSRLQQRLEGLGESDEDSRG
ncbi:MAG TPA: ECF-type sigma factor [Phycisphaerales bacterium]|nr:ECF-type sigma factor [Phycisphaerales bacterium]